MEFIAYEDGTIKDEFYREEKEVKFFGAPHVAQRAAPRATGNVVRKQAYNYGPRLVSESAPFACTPTQVEFRDFDVGKSYTAAVKLTNVTGDFSTFRVMPITPEFSEIVSVEYSPPSRISAGLSCSIVVKCTPQSPVDISTEIAIRTATGYFALPVKLLTKRSRIVVQPSVLDFGTLVIGDSRKKTISVENNGASPASLTISGTFKKVAEKTHENPQTGKSVPFLTVDALTYRIDVGPFSKHLFDVVFTPFESVTLGCDVVFTEKIDDGERKHTVPIKGNATELPVHITTGDVDFDWCFFESTYSTEIRVCNTSNVAATVTPVVTPALKSVVRIDPPNTCVQAGCEMPLLLTFTPQRGMPESFAACIDFSVKGQTLPATFSLVAKLTERVPAVESPEIDCGSLFTNEEAGFPLAVRNQSTLPQMIGFLSVPENIRVFPEVDTVLPGESYTFQVCVLPPGPGEFSQQFILCNEYGDKENITVYGTGDTPVLFFSECTVDLPRCAIGSQVSASVVLTNLSKQAQQFSFYTPDVCLTISPSSGSLKPQEGVVVLVTLTPPEEFVEVKRPSRATGANSTATAPGSSTSGSKTKRLRSHTESRDSSVTRENSTELVASYTDWDQRSGEAWSRRRRFILQCRTNDGTNRPSKLQVNCTVVTPRSVIRPLEVQLPAPVADADAAKGTRKTLRAPQLDAHTEVSALSAHFLAAKCVVSVDFHEVSLNHATTSLCVIRNNENLPCLYKLQPTDPVSPFTVLRYPLTLIPPGGEDVVVIRFHPTDYGTHSQTLRLTSQPSNDIVIHLLGRCCSTEFTVTVDGAEKTEDDAALSVKNVHFDATVIGSVSRIPLLYENKGSFPLDVSFEQAQGRTNAWVREHTFFFNPSAFTIPPHGTVRSIAYFDPKLEGLHVQPIVIKAGGFEHCIEFEGRAASLPVYVVLPGVERNPLDEDTELVSRNGGDREMPIFLHFAPGETKTIVIGSTKGGPGFECAVDNWDDSFAKAGWSISGTAKQAVAGGLSTAIGITLAANVSGDTALSYCACRIVIRCSADSANDRVFFVRCAGS